jgi:phospholipase D-like protein/putative oligomerization/nucleic acid binding protein
MIDATRADEAARRHRMFAADYPFLDIFWTMLIFFCWVIWIWMVIGVFADIFSRRDISGWAKAAWSVFVIVLPFLGVLIYLIANSDEMAQRKAGQAQAAQAEFDDYVKTVAAPGGPATEVEAAKRLLDSGAVTQAEFDAMKAKALA